MNHFLRHYNQLKQRSSSLFIKVALLLIPTLWSAQSMAQLSTDPLAVTSVCPGAQLDVTGLRSGPADSYGIELSSDGLTYVEVPSIFVTASGRYEITYRATIPANTTPGSSYRVRFISRNPDVKGSPSSSLLRVNAKPAPPAVLSNITGCQKAATSNEITIIISVTASSPAASTQLYNQDGSVAGYFRPSSDAKSFEISKFVPGTKTYYVTQQLDGCESDRKETNVTIKPLPPVVAPLNAFSQDGFGGSFGKIDLCQGDKAVSLKEFGIKPLPDNVVVVYIKESGDLSLTGLPDGSTYNGAGTTIPPVPATDKPGKATITFRTYLDGCPASVDPVSRLVVTVNARPGKPTTTTNSLSICQSQALSPLSATTNVAGASLVWYGASATGGTGTITPAQPATDKVGTFRYYVAQKSGDCESERAEITVEIKPAPAMPEVQSVAVCQNAAAPIIKAAGQNLLWYTGQTGGTSSLATPVISTSQTGQVNYYVSQSVNGCESARAMFTATVNATPGVPAVASLGPAYCQNAPAIPLVATGQDLKWYRESSGGTSLGSTLTPDTKTAGATTYYVSQSNNGCEGARSSITVTVTAQPSAPAVTSSFSYCQKAPASVLTASGTNLKWYDPSGKSSDVAPAPSTDTPGTVSYFVTQSASGCESGRAEIKVTIKPTPDAPGVQSVAICQNAAAPTLTATGQNLLWYTAQAGETGNATVPVISTGQPGSATYYISQNVDGCESPRVALVVTVKVLPAAPTVTPKVICQFAPPEPVSATGENLTWYNVDGNKFGAAPVIGTDKGASFSVLVSQTVNGCEGPKATQSVTVVETPMPTVGKATVEVCQGATAQPLSATGIGLKWTDPTGKVTTVAPTPATLNVSKNSDGDLFYVTQTINGCESPKVTIHVFVQSPPTLSVLGTTTTNLGLEVPLKLMFTGVGPYTYKLTNGLAGTTTKDTTLLILADRTTTYQVIDVANKCGAGLPGSGSLATITVLVPTIQTQALTSSTLCAGSSLTTNFTTSGTFNQGSVFKLQLAKVETDTTKIAFADLTGGQAGNGQISGTIPANTPAGTYWVRVLATNPKIPIKGANSPTLLTVRPLPVATLVGNQTIFEGQPASLTVVFSGDGPWTFAYRDSSATGLGASRSVTTAVSPYSFDVRPAKTTSYVLAQVSNGCGTGTLAARSVVVTVNQLLGIEDQILAEAVDVYPVPVTSMLTVRIRGLSSSQTATLELTDLAGHTTHRQETRQVTTSLSLDQHPAGTYILRIRVGDRTASKRVMKL